ncbi:hypothetical protein [Burkholderia multivorans]|uniref:hypothetical protein n=1 Tax=Burkholderia multivorans TaxID=87883 RepID=UPI001687D797|nr:hypothetical protein [Burkholderia multivorans]
MTFKLEMNESDVAGALGAVKIIPPAESKEEPTTLSLFRKLAADGPVTTLHLQELTPLQEMEKKAADLEAALQRLRISDERDRPFRDRDRRFRQRDRSFRERDRADRKAGLALRMTSTTRAMLAGFGRRQHARAPDEHAHDQGRFTT